MTSQIQAKLFEMLTVALVVVVFPGFAEVPSGVSPGAVDRIAQIEGRCPSFSWGMVPGAAYYQLVGYRLPEGLEPSELDLSHAEHVLYTEVPGSATSWTPDLAQCLTPGEGYVWFVRAVFDEEGGASPNAGEWSYGRFFSISPVPSAREVQEALSVLRRYTDQADSGVLTIDPQDREPAITGERLFAARHGSAVPTQAGKSVISGKTAITGSVSDMTGETYGVVGISNSPEGAGVGAAGADGGADLVLDGSVGLLPDTLLSESGIDRPWATDVTFNVQNSAGGAMTLQVDGVDVVTTATDQDTVGGLSCRPDQVAKWTGSEWACASDETGSLWAANGDHIYNLNVGNVGIGTNEPDTPLHVEGGGDVEPTFGGYAVLGAIDGLNLAFDDNEIMARENGATATLFLNHNGGDVDVGGNLVVNGLLNAGYQLVESDFATVAVVATCPTGLVVTGGGCYAGEGVSETRPLTPPQQGWYCVAQLTTGSVKAYAICARLGAS